MIFLTGFPGFLGTRLVQRLRTRFPDERFAFLVQPKFTAKARAVIQKLGLERAEVLPGDITQRGLGLDPVKREVLQDEITQAYHLAAVYDLSIPRKIGWLINVEGTRHVVEFLLGCTELEAFHYISTAYVSGNRTGHIQEDELQHAAGFKNHYEETKYEAEVIVREHMNRLPTIVFRPAVVVGDTETGATEKFDGPYYILKVLQRLPNPTLMVRIGSGQHTVNVVPVDFVTGAIAQLANRREHFGKTFHLADPDPLTTQEMMELFLGLMGKQAAFVPVPASLARLLVQTPVGSLIGITPQMIDYFDHPSTYDTAQTEEALHGSGIACPRFPEYADRLVAFMESNAGTRSGAMY